MITLLEKELRHTWMIFEIQKLYEEDYQMKMLYSNTIPGLLSVQGQGLDEKSRYRYEITGKSSMKLLGDREKWNSFRMEEFMRQFIQTLKEVENYLLNVNCISLNPEHIFYSEGKYFFSYCPAIQKDLWTEFHQLTEYFVRETNYEDKEAVYFAYELHKSSMEENYNIEEILEKILERKEAEMKRVTPDVKEMSYELEEDKILDEWAGGQEIRNNVMRERTGVWGFVSRKLQKNS